MFHTKGPILPTYESFIAKLLQKFDFTLAQARIQFRNLKLWPCSCQRKTTSVCLSPLPAAKNRCELLNSSGCSLQFPVLSLQLYPSRATQASLKWLQTDALRCLAPAVGLSLVLYAPSSSCSRPRRRASSPPCCHQPCTFIPLLVLRPDGWRWVRSAAAGGWQHKAGDIRKHFVTIKVSANRHSFQ